MKLLVVTAPLLQLFGFSVSAVDSKVSLTAAAYSAPVASAQPAKSPKHFIFDIIKRFLSVDQPGVPIKGCGKFTMFP